MILRVWIHVACVCVCGLLEKVDGDEGREGWGLMRIWRYKLLSWYHVTCEICTHFSHWPLWPSSPPLHHHDQQVMSLPCGFVVPTEPVTVTGGECWGVQPWPHDTAQGLLCLHAARNLCQECGMYMLACLEHVNNHEFLCKVGIYWSYYHADT